MNTRPSRELTPAQQEARERYVKAARDFWDHITTDTTLARAHATRVAKSAGVPEDMIREWDDAVAREMFPGFGPR